MASSKFISALFASLLLLITKSPTSLSELSQESAVPKSDVDLLEFPLNLEYLEAEFFLWGTSGHGLDKVDPKLAMGGPPPVGTRKANLDPFTRDLMTQFAYQEVGHLRAIKKSIRGFPRPLLNLSANSFATVMDSAFGHPLRPPFDPYANGLNFLIASYLLPYVGLTGYLVAGLLAVESAQDAVIRSLLYERATLTVQPYRITVVEFTRRISELRNRLGGAGVKDEGLVVPPVMGAERKLPGNVIAGNGYSVAYDRTPKEILRIVYGAGSERSPGGFFPHGADGRIAKSYLRSD